MDVRGARSQWPTENVGAYDSIRPCFDSSGFISFEIKAGRLEVATPRFTFRLCWCPLLCDLGVLCLCLGCLGFASDTKREVCCGLKVRGELSERTRKDVERTGKKVAWRASPVFCKGLPIPGVWEFLFVSVAALLRGHPEGSLVLHGDKGPA